MAYAVLVSLVQTIEQILNDDRFPISVSGKQKIESIQKKVILLQKYLENFPMEAYGVERRIRDAANEGQDIMEHFMYEQLRSHYKLTRATAAGIESVNLNRFYDFQELKRVEKEINSIAKEVVGFDEDSPTSPSSSLAKLRSTGDDNVDGFDLEFPAVSRSSSTKFSSAGDDIVVGFDEDFSKIRDMLCGGSSKLEVIPIQGMGGIGKTTLARSIYKSQSIMYHFGIRIWVTLSSYYVTENVLSNLIGIEEPEKSGESIESIRDKAFKLLKNKRYLVVLDDIRSVEEWDDWRRIFPDDDNDSRIMLTTRKQEVASYAASSSSSSYQMHELNPDVSWNLLGQKVFKQENFPLQLEKLGEEVAIEFEKFGRDIVRSCGGLPLAIVLIAGLLSSVSTTKEKWKEIITNILSAVAKEGQFEKIMSLSYAYLPHHLRACFLYMGCFPEKYEIHVSKLIKLWIAEGFVKPCSSSNTYEGCAEEYLEDLVKRSLVNVASRKSNGKIMTCRLHHLVREWSIRRAQEENYKRRLSIAHTDLKFLSKTYGSTLRSIISFQPSDSSLDSLRKFRLLRVLDVTDANVYSLPAQVFELFHLRYLGFGCPMKIPAAISRLQNLHSLVIWPRKGSMHYLKDEVYLPKEIWMLPLLRHLVSFFDLLPDQEEDAHVLGNLHTLSLVKIFVCSESMLKRVANLKKLAIIYDGERYLEDYQLENLDYLHQLETLKLIRNGGSVAQGRPVFPSSLKKLTLSGWQFPWEFMEMIGSLPNLQVLKLRDFACKGEIWETSEGQFLRLEYLLIDRSDLKMWITESTHFPILKCLVLFCCSLIEIPYVFGEISTLELIEVDQANEALFKSAQKIQEEQRSFGNEDLKVRHVRYQYQGF